MALREITKKKHFQRLRETSEIVWPVIEKVVSNLLTQKKCQALRPHMEVFLQKRRGQLLLRPYLCRMAYDLAGGKNWHKKTNIFAATELLNISTYQSNLCFDNKYQWETERDSANQYISSMISLSLAIRLIESQPGVDHNAKNAAISLLTEVNGDVYLGQFIDLNQLTLRNVNNFIKAGERRFLNDYLWRCRLIGGSMFMVTCIGALIADPEWTPLPILQKYLSALGVAGQILNDLADYIPNANRPYASQYGDVRMGRLTYPTFLLAMSEHPAIYQQTHIQNIDIHLLSSATEWLLRNNAGHRIHCLLKTECWETIRKSIRDIATQTTDDAVTPLLFARHYVFDSRMLSFFMPQKKGHNST